MRCSVCGKVLIPCAVAMNRLHGEDEDQQCLSGLALALKEKEPDVCLF